LFWLSHQGDLVEIRKQQFKRVRKIVSRISRFPQLEAVARGVDMFDCVMPTRNGRHGVAFTRFGQVNLRNARHADDPRPLDDESTWPSTRGYSRAYLHHLVKSGETLGAMLLSEINVAYYQRLMHDIRDAISKGTFASFRDCTRAEWARGDIAPR
jgi:queuine tRNA-ribosyltransferase